MSGAPDGGVIFHDGIIGDARHQMTGSLQNDGRAIDINAIQIGTKLYRYSSKAPEVQSFFQNLRECWGRVVNSYRGGCLYRLKGGTQAPGTLGDEDHRPFCPNVAASLGRYIAVLQLLSPALAIAQDNAQPAEGPASTYKYESIALGQWGEAKLTIEDTGGEPVGAPIRLSVDHYCPPNKKGKAKKPRQVIHDLGSCGFENLGFDGKTRMLTLTFMSNVINAEGTLTCNKRDTKRVKIHCP